MRPRHRVSRAAVDLIKRFEGYRQKAAQLPDGRWTIGYGHTLTARAGAEISEADAEALLLYDLMGVGHVVGEQLFAPLNQNQFDALAAFAFNLGIDAFRRSEVLLRINEGQLLQAACAMELWRKAEFEGERIVIDALVRRRAAEKALFLTPPDGAWAHAPTPALRPLIDLDARELVPRDAPVAVLATLSGDTVDLRREGAAPAAVTVAAAAVTHRLQTIFPDAEPAPIQIRADEADTGEARPQADFAPPVGLHMEEPPQDAEPEPARPTSTDEADPAGNPDLDIPIAPPGSETRSAPDRVLIDDLAPYEFIPARVQPLPRRREPSVIWDLLLGLLGLAFFGFALFWGWNARPDGADALVTPRLVAWLAGVAGLGFIVVAIFRLLQRLGRVAERD